MPRSRAGTALVSWVQGAEEVRARAAQATEAVVARAPEDRVMGVVVARAREDWVTGAAEARVLAGLAEVLEAQARENTEVKLVAEARGQQLLEWTALATPSSAR